MLIDLEAIKKGDEVMIAMGSRLIKVVVLRDIQVKMVKDEHGNKVPYHRSWGRDRGRVWYSSVKCKIKIAVKINTYNSTSGMKIYLYKEMNNSLPDYNDEKYVDFNGRDVWLVRPNAL